MHPTLKSTNGGSCNYADSCNDAHLTPAAAPYRVSGKVYAAEASRSKETASIQAAVADRSLKKVRAAVLERGDDLRRQFFVFVF